MTSKPPGQLHTDGPPEAFVSVVLGGNDCIVGLNVILQVTKCDALASTLHGTEDLGPAVTSLQVLRVRSPGHNAVVVLLALSHNTLAVLHLQNNIVMAWCLHILSGFDNLLAGIRNLIRSWLL